MATESILVRIKYTVDFNVHVIAPIPPIVSGQQFMGDLIRVSVLPPGQQEQDFMNISSQEVFKTDPYNGDNGPFYYINEHKKMFECEKENFPLRPDRGQYIIKLNALSAHLNWKSDDVSLADSILLPSISIWADGVKVVDSSYPSTINKVEHINTEWTFIH